MPEWQPPAPPQGTPRPDRPPAGHARLSLSPAVRAVASVAAAFALLVAGLTPALPLLRPQVARAAEYSMKTAATYEIAPGEGNVRVSIDVTFRNTTPDPPGQFSVFPTIDLAVHDGARNVRAEDGRGRRLQTTLQERGGVNVASVQPRPPVRYRDSARFTLSYTLDDGASTDVRIRPSVVIVPIWSFGTQGSVTVRLPSDYEVLVDGDSLHAEQDGSAWQLESGAVVRSQSLAGPRDSHPAVELRHRRAPGAAQPGHRRRAGPRVVR